MESTESFFDIEEQGDTLIVTPQSDLGEFEFERINAGMKAVLARIAGSSVKNVILDFHKTTYYGSTALGFFVRLWKAISTRKGRMVLCNLSEHEREILMVTKLESLWDLCATKEDALKRLRQ